MNEKGEMLVSCRTHYMKGQGGQLVYRDPLSRWPGNSLGNNLLQQHLGEAIAKDLNVRLVKATTSDVKLVNSGGDASQAKNVFSVCEDVVGRVTMFDGDEFEIVFSRK